MSSLQKLEIEQRLRLVLLRNRGVIRDTIDDYEREFGKRLSQDYVLRVYRKFRREVRQDNLRWVSYHFAQEFIAQAAKVQHQLSKQLQEYNERSVTLRSICCSSVVKPHPCEEGAFLCLKCDTQCDVEEVMDKSMEKLKLQVIEKLQREQDLTMRFLEGMGFLQKRSGQGVLAVGVERTLDALPSGNVSRVPQKPDLDPDLQKELDSMDPRDAQMMLDGGLELTVEFEDDKDETSEQKVIDK
jgi:hypothetical protein